MGSTGSLEKRFTVFTDHKPLEEMNIKLRTDEDLDDRRYYLSQFNFEVIYSLGKHNVEADSLSRKLEPYKNQNKNKNKK